MDLTLGELARSIGAEFQGPDPDFRVSAIATLKNARPGQISFLANPRYRRDLKSTQASAVILRAGDVPACSSAVLVMENPYLGYARAAAVLNPEPRPAPGIHPSASVSAQADVHPSAAVGSCAVVEDQARIGPDVVIGPGCVVGVGAEVGEASRLVANVTLCHHVVLGRRVLVQPGAVIGGDGFGMARDGERWIKVPQLGRVVVADDVEVGANTTIDRGALDDTVIEQGVKLDNLVQVAHNVHIGAHAALAGCAGVAGSTRIGARCTLGGGVGLSGHIELADDVHVTGASVVFQSIREAGVYSSGTPLQENRAWRRNFVRQRQLDEMHHRIKTLEAKVDSSGDEPAAEEQ